MIRNNLLEVKVPRKDLLSDLYASYMLKDDTPTINNMTHDELSHYMDDKFGISLNSLNSSLLTSIFFDYLDFLSNSDMYKKLFISSLTNLNKIKYDAKILDYFCDLSVYLESIFPGNYNLIGGKVTDLVNGVSFEDSTGDFDIWITGLADSEAWKLRETLLDKLPGDRFKLDEDKTRDYCLTVNDVTYNVTIQLILNYQFNEVNDIFTKFDFLHCCIGIDKKNIFWRHGALKAIKQKNIIINGLYPSRVLHERLMKYINRGYKISYSNFILCSISTLFGVFNAPSIPVSYARFATFDNPFWSTIRGSGSYDSVLNDNF